MSGCCNRIADDGPDVKMVSDWPLCDRLECERDAVCEDVRDGIPYCAGHAPEWHCRPLYKATIDIQPAPLAQPTDAHYAALGVQPIECVEAWLPTWDARVGYHLGESVQMIARCGTRGQAARDLRKAAWLLLRAADIIEAGKARPAMDTSPSKP